MLDLDVICRREKVISSDGRHKDRMVALYTCNVVVRCDRAVADVADVIVMGVVNLLCNLYYQMISAVVVVLFSW